MATNGVVIRADRIEPAASNGHAYLRPMARAAKLGTVPRAFPTALASTPDRRATPITGNSRGQIRRAERRMPRTGPNSSMTMAGATATNTVITTRPGKKQSTPPISSSTCTKNQATRRANVRRPVARSADPTVSSPPRYDAATTLLMAPATKGATSRLTRPTIPATTSCALLLPLVLDCRAGLLTASKKPRPPYTLRWAKAEMRWRGTTKAAVINSSVRQLALRSLKAPSRMSLSVIGCNGSGPVRVSPALGSGPYGDVCHGSGAGGGGAG